MASLTHLDPNEAHQSSTGFQWSPKQTTIDLVGGIYCNICHLTIANKKDYDSHYARHSKGKDIIYTCVICYKEIAGYPSFRGHCYTNHVIKDRFKCEHCSKLFSKFAALKDHVNIVHKFKCTSCSKEFASKKEMQLHQIIHNDSDKPPYECKYCKNEIETLEGCKDHVDMHTEFTYSCPICNENISDKANAGDHLKQHFAMEEFNDDADDLNDKGAKATEETLLEQLGGIGCQFCDVVYPNRVEFDAHFSCDHGDEDIIYMCVVCEKPFEKYSLFYNHCYNHSMKKKYECERCQKQFPRLCHLVTHAAACQQDGAGSGKPFVCTECGHRFGTESRLSEHMRDQHAARQLLCPHPGCAQLFENTKELIIHQRHHSSTVQNWCRQCRLFFTNVASCERHIDVHKKKLYFCPICNRSYKEKYMIVKHLPQHFETVLHLCRVCGKMYNLKRRLIEHMKTHSNVKSHTCTLCDKSFSKPQQLEHHLNVHTGSRPYKCDICSKAFASKPNWHKHMRRMHNTERKDDVNSPGDTMEGIGEDETTMETAIDENEDDDMSVSNKDENDEADLNLGYTEEELDVHVIAKKLNTDDVANSFEGEITENGNNDDEIINDIDEANASIDFANVKLETYIFNVEEDRETVNIEKVLSDNTPAPAAPEDILEYIADMPTNSSLFPADIGQEPAGPSGAPVGFPREYGPEFNAGAAGGSGFIDLDDHILPHIDPLLTIKNEGCEKMYVQMQNNHENYVPIEPAHYQTIPKWEPPIITKLYDDYTYGYGEMADASRLSIMNTDIF